MLRKEYLVQNSSFEQQFRVVDGQSSIVVAEQWMPFWAVQKDGDPDWQNRKPEFTPAAPYLNRIHVGQNAQHWFNFYGTNERAGVYQRIHVDGGAEIHVSAMMHAWSGDDDDIVSGPDFGNVQLFVGIDPTGGTDPFADCVSWRAPVTQYDKFVKIEHVVVAEAEYVTIFLASSSEWAVKHNDVYLDSVACWGFVDDTTPVDPPEPGEEGTLTEQIRLAGQNLVMSGQNLVSLGNQQIVEGQRMLVLSEDMSGADEMLEKLAKLL